MCDYEKQYLIEPAPEGFQYDFFSEEWSYTCKACNTELFAPTKKHMESNVWLHTHSNDCLGGW